MTLFYPGTLVDPGTPDTRHTKRGDPMRDLITCTLLAMLVGCGAQPTKPATTETSTNVAPAAPAAPTQAAPAAATQASIAVPVQPAPGGSTGEQPAAKIPAGFREKKIKGQVYYCRSEATIGSKFKEELCYTQDQLDDIARRADEVMDVVGKGCVGGGCGVTD
jgi:hypothetical protein